MEVENDDFGTPAIVLATLTGGGMLRIAAGSSVRIAGPQRCRRAARPGRLPAQRSTRRPAPRKQGPERTSRAATAPTPTVRRRHPASGALRTPAAGRQCPGAARRRRASPACHDAGGDRAQRRRPGADPGAGRAPRSPWWRPSRKRIRTPWACCCWPTSWSRASTSKSGSCLKDLSDLAHELFIMLKDPDAALAVADLLNVLPFDGNPGRWASVEASLALSSYICRQTGRRTARPSTRSCSGRRRTRKRTPSRPGCRPRCASGR